MALIRPESGCKVGWETYDNLDEAKARAEWAVIEGRARWAQGYDFGYQSPGEIRPNADETEFTVTIP